MSRQYSYGDRQLTQRGRDNPRNNYKLGVMLGQSQLYSCPQAQYPDYIIEPIILLLSTTGLLCYWSYKWLLFMVAC